MLTSLQLQQALHARGLRMTAQRRFIVEAIAALASSGHLSPDAIYRRVAREFPRVNPSTVYRTLDLLEELGYLRHTHFHDGGARYHSAEEAAHQHLVCVACGAELGLDVTLLDPLAEELRRRYGFAADLAHVALVGRCRGCQEGGTQRPEHNP